MKTLDWGTAPPSDQRHTRMGKCGQRRKTRSRGKADNAERCRGSEMEKTLHPRSVQLESGHPAPRCRESAEAQEDGFQQPGAVGYLCG